MSIVNSVLEAGGLVPATSKISQSNVVDTISGRCYQHAALGDRCVVRLTPDALAQGEDLALEFLGFASPEVVGPIAMRRQQALGFPGWALINDPKHARYALEIVKEFRREARRAKSKPGHAYDGFTAIAEKLGRSVAHFLPSFWEEVGRELIAVGNNTYAGRAFNKAREAEKVHALKVDETIRQQAFIEFALAGCLSNKALTEYGKELQESHNAEDAWSFFRELCLRRTKGGMPPWMSMPKELAQLAASAGLDANDELTRVLEEIVEMPAMRRAAIGFWKGCSKVMPALAKANDQIAGALLNMLPEVGRWNQDPIWEWLELLETWGLLDNLWGDDVPAAARPKNGPAAWLSKIAAVNSNPPQIVLDLLPKMAACLRQNDEPVKLPAVDRWGSSYCVDLLDLALELKIPIASPPEDARFDLGAWSKTTPTDNRPRDPVHIHADNRFRDTLIENVANHAGGADFEAAAVGKTALKEARRNWLLGLLDSAESGGLPQTVNSLDKLTDSTNRAHFQEFPEAYERLKSLDLAPVFQRTLHYGVIDEYGWPALEQAAETLASADSESLRFFGAAPHVIVTDGLRAIVVGPRQVVAEYELQLLKDFEVERLNYLDGHLHVRMNKRHQRKKFWSHDPKKLIDSHFSYAAPISGATVPVASGGSFVGEATVHAGDTKIGRSRPFFSDGEHFWRVDSSDDVYVIREVDPTTGKLGRQSLPAFFEDFLKDGWMIDEHKSELLNLGPGTEDSPLGCVDGLTGWRVLRDADSPNRRDRYYTVPTRIECERIDGKKWNTLIGDRRIPVGLLDQPGTDACLVIDGEFGWTWSYGRELETCSTWSPDGQIQLSEIRAKIGPYCAGQAVGLPPIFWHAFVTRDVKASKKLRAITKSQAAKLFDAAKNDVANLDADSTSSDDVPAALPKIEAAVRKWMPSLECARFARGLAGIAFFAARQAERIQQLSEDRDPAAKDPIGTVSDIAVIKPAMTQLGIQAGFRGSEDFYPHVTEVVAFFRGEQEAGTITSAPFDWSTLLNGLESLAWRAFWLEEQGDSAYLDFLEVWASLGMIDLPGSIRKFEGKFTAKEPFAQKSNQNSPENPCYTFQFKTSRYILWLRSRFNSVYHVIEFTEAKRFQDLPKFEMQVRAVGAVTEMHRTWSSDRLRSYVAAFREREKPILDKAVLKQTADRIGVSAGELGLVWMGYPNLDTYSKNFLPKTLRESLGLKVNEAEAARTALKSLKPETRSLLVSKLLDGDPQDLWDDNAERALNRLADAWSGSVPKRLDIPAELITAIAGRNQSTRTMEALANPRQHAALTSDAKWSVGLQHKDRGHVELGCDSEDTFDFQMLAAATFALPLFYSKLPGGAEAMSLAVEVRERVIECLRQPGLLFDLGRSYHVEEKKKNAAEQFYKTLHGKIRKDRDVMHYEDGIVVSAATGKTASWAFRPSMLHDKSFEVHIGHIIAFIEGSTSFANAFSAPMRCTQRINSPEYQGICDRIRSGDIQPGQFDANPLNSAANIVQQVAKHHKVDEDAAVLYLQLLALHDPTTANIKAWNGWTPARIKKAGRVLAAADLVLEAKRARAGRNLFLPGGWEALKAPHLPMESWKLPFYVQADERFPFSRIVPLCSYPDLFAKAWQRTLDGDAPAYEEVK